ncbi:MAG: hypothetical protein KC983_10975, partial [Phycisphaerales bacterium]|nr:hypothetical protein [Phycisphaerales bacterium]
MSRTKLLICPYCGETQSESERCTSCGGLFEPLSRQATHNAMGPWYIRDVGQPFRPGCSHDTLMMLVDRGVVTRTTVVRGPTTRQFWTVARRVPGLAHRLGYCHACDARVDAGDESCHACGAAFSVYFDRNDLGLPEIRPLPWEDASAAGAGRQHHPASTNEWMSMGGRLSSFATDEQLFSQSAGHSAGTIAAPAPMPVTNGSALETHDDRMPTQATINALQRTVQRQERLVRRLGIVAAVAIGIGIIMLIMILMRGGAESAANSAREHLSEKPGTAADTADTDDVAEPARTSASSGAPAASSTSSSATEHA